jgi:hypothetical protein
MRFALQDLIRSRTVFATRTFTRTFLVTCAQPALAEARPTQLVCTCSHQVMHHIALCPSVCVCVYLCFYFQMCRIHTRPVHLPSRHMAQCQQETVRVMRTRHVPARCVAWRVCAFVCAYESLYVTFPCTHILCDEHCRAVHVRVQRSSVARECQRLQQAYHANDRGCRVCEWLRRIHVVRAVHVRCWRLQGPGKQCMHRLPQ